MMLYLEAPLTPSFIPEVVVDEEQKGVVVIDEATKSLWGQEEEVREKLLRPEKEETIVSGIRSRLEETALHETSFTSDANSWAKGGSFEEIEWHLNKEHSEKWVKKRNRLQRLLLNDIMNNSLMLMTASLEGQSDTVSLLWRYLLFFRR